MSPIETLTERLNAKGLEVTPAEGEAIAVRCAGSVDDYLAMLAGHEKDLAELIEPWLCFAAMSSMSSDFVMLRSPSTLKLPAVCPVCFAPRSPGTGKEPAPGVAIRLLLARDLLLEQVAEARAGR